MDKLSPLPRSFYHRDPVTVARALLGQTLVRIIEHKRQPTRVTRLAGIIVETEAYLGLPDRAAHTYNGRRTPRNQTMWGDGGHAYVYFTYGMHHCVNAVVSQPDDPVAVLIRALQPTEGIDLMFQHRNTGKNRAQKQTQLCAGPARLCQALQIDRTLDGTDLTQTHTLYIERTRPRTLPKNQIIVTPRIGIPNAADWTAKPLRFYIRNNPHVTPTHA